MRVFAHVKIRLHLYYANDASGSMQFYKYFGKIRITHCECAEFVTNELDGIYYSNVGFVWQLAAAVFYNCLHHFVIKYFQLNYLI